VWTRIAHANSLFTAKNRVLKIKSKTGKPTNALESSNRTPALKILATLILSEASRLQLGMSSFMGVHVAVDLNDDKIEVEENEERIHKSKEKMHKHKHKSKSRSKSKGKNDNDNYREKSKQKHKHKDRDDKDEVENNTGNEQIQEDGPNVNPTSLAASKPVPALEFEMPSKVSARSVAIACQFSETQFLIMVH
jgi:hypothetical protein